ncbi:MAG: DUF4034 domain-containing protein [Candidatus Sumerlaeia bacterium]|nr:DUF4034 domain-containing protein [Candidatus Sumerlaeia bacterium]
MTLLPRRWLVHVACLMLLVCVVRAQPSPWDAPAPPHRGTLLILPARDDADSFPVARQALITGIGWELRAHAPAGLGFPATSEVLADLKRMAPYHPDGVPVVDEHIAAMIRYHAATHVLHSRWSAQDGVERLECRLTGKDTEASATFEASATHPGHLAHRIALWILATGDFGFDEAAQARFATPCPEPTTPEPADAADPLEWVRWYASGMESDAPHNAATHRLLLAFYLQANSVEQHEAPPQWQALVDGTPDDPPPSQLLTAGLTHLWQEDSAAARAALWSYLALQPGDTMTLDLVANAAYGKGNLREEFLEHVRDWFARAPESPARDVLLASMLHHSAWDYRGGGFADTVTDEGFRHFHSLKRLSISYCQKAEAVAGPLPMIIELLLNGHGSLSEISQLKAAYRRGTAAYPSDGVIMRTMLHFTRPRWGGTIQEGMRLIDERFENGQMTARFGLIPAIFHFGEAVQLFGEEEPSQVAAVRRYMRTFPEARAQVLRAAELLLDFPTMENAAYAASVAWVVPNRPAIHKAVQANPRLIEAPDKSFYLVNKAEFMRYALRYLAEVEAWDEMAEIIPRLAPDMQQHPWTNPEAFETAEFSQVAVCLGDIHGYMLTLARVASNWRDPLEGRVLDGCLNLGTVAWAEAYACFLNAHLNKGGTNPERLLRATNRVARAWEADPDVPRIAAATRALIAWHAGDQELARTELERMNPSRRMWADWVRRETCLVIQGALPPDLEPLLADLATE